MALTARTVSKQALPGGTCSSIWCLPPTFCTASRSRVVAAHSHVTSSSNAIISRRPRDAVLWPTPVHCAAVLCHTASAGRHSPLSSSSSSSHIPAPCIQHGLKGVTSRRRIQCAAAAATAAGGGEPPQGSSSSSSGGSSSQDVSSLTPAASAAASGIGAGSATLRAMGSQNWVGRLPAAIGSILSACGAFLAACWQVLPQFQGPPLPQALQRMGLVLGVSLVMVVVLCTIDSAWLFCYLLRARRLAA